MEEDEDGDHVDLVVAGHLGRGCGCYGTEVVTNAGIGDDKVKEGDIVGLERGDGGGGGGVVLIVYFYDDEGCVSSFGDVLEVLAGRGVADAGYDCVVWAREVGSQKAIANACVDIC